MITLSQFKFSFYTHVFAFIASILAYSSSFLTGDFIFCGPFAIIIGSSLFDSEISERKRILGLLPILISVGLFFLFKTRMLIIQKAQLSTIIIVLGIMLDIQIWKLNQSLVLRTIHKFLTAVISIFVSLFSGCLLAGLIYGIKSLFNLTIPDHITYISVGLGAFFYIESLNFLQQSLQKNRLSVLIDKAAQFVFLPFFYLYSLLLFFYELKLLLLQETPKGYASIPANIALALWIFLESYNSMLITKKFKVSFLIPWVSIFLLNYGVYLRINEYGLTPERIYLATWAILINVTALSFILRRKLELLLPISCGLGFLTITLIPSIDVEHLSGRSQLNRLIKTISKEGSQKELEEMKTSLDYIKAIYTEDLIKLKINHMRPELKEADISTIIKNINSLNSRENCASFNAIKHPISISQFKHGIFLDPLNTKQFVLNSELKLKIEKSKIEVTHKSGKIKSFSLEKLISNGSSDPLIIRDEVASQKFEIVFLQLELCKNYNSFTGIVFY